MTIRDLAEVQSDSVDIKVFETVDGLAVEKASFNSNFYSIITEEFLAQVIATMTARKTNGNSVYIELTTVPEDGGETTENAESGGATDLGD